MLFNSIDFAVFLPIVFALYWVIGNRHIKIQNLLLLVASYVFYGWWDWRFLSLILLSSSIDFLIGISLLKTQNNNNRKLLLYTSLLVNLGLLGFFKYYNFFTESFVDAFTFFGQSIDVSRLNIILPIGISFYTFQTLSYTIDVYNRKFVPKKDVISFFAFVSFFPQLVAGPIERATHLLPQFYKNRFFDYNNGFQGLTLIIWGLFKKMVVADNCALIVNQIFDGYENYSGSTLVLGAVLFAFQIYGDFSGYSDIAIGTSKLFGFDLKANFKLPYFSRDIAEFWRRWHISLSTWFRDYLYIPLGGSRGNTTNKIRNIFIIFVVSGFWHGANWTFIVWGFINALYFLPLMFLNKNRKNINIVAQGKYLPTFKEILQILFTFGLTTFAWIFFRSDSIPMAFNYISNIFTPSLFSLPYAFGIGVFQVVLTLTFIILLLIIEWFGREKENPIYVKNRTLQWLILYIFTMIIFLFSEKPQEFIYFQF